MKIVKRIAAVFIAVVMVCGLFACVDKNKPTPGPGGTTDNITPASIKQLAAITNCGQQNQYFNPGAATYSADVVSEKRIKLDARIREKKEDTSVTSTVVKIFANSTGEGIIEAMRIANLPQAKMEKTVDYLAGEESVTEEQIQTLVNSGTFNANDTKNWSFFDDWTYYEKLQDRADQLKGAEKTQKDNADDNVKRQYRNMLGKVFDIGMTLDEFARVATRELVYATSVTNTMSGATLSIGNSESAYDNYFKENLDYETLVYLRAFNEYYNNGTNLADCVELYAYYYEYSRNNYYSQDDDTFEKQLEYSHMDTYTDAQWLEYVDIQRKSYLAMRYTDAFTATFYNKHISFQKVSEKHEKIVYDLDDWRGKSYSQEMTSALNLGGLIGQLNFNDWTWCYAGNNDAMKSYNKAHTDYYNTHKEGSSAGIEKESEAEFNQNMEMLKAVEYLLTKVGSEKLGQTLYFEVYSYSAEVVKTAREYNKEIKLIKDNRKSPEEATVSLMEGLNESDKKPYAVGKLGALISQLGSNYDTASPDTKAGNAKIQDWSGMLTNVTNAINYQYTGKYSGENGRLEMLENNVIKKKYSCRAALDDPNCKLTPNEGHVKCTKEYDETHAISKFALNYESILRYMAGQAQISFMKQLDTKMEIKVYEGTQTWTVGYKGDLKTVLGKNRDDLVKYNTLETVSAKSGESFVDGADSLNWWRGESARPEKAAYNADSETNASNQPYPSVYTYTFKGWYLDQNWEYVFDENDEIKFDLSLYAGYNVTKAKK